LSRVPLMEIVAVDTSKVSKRDEQPTYSKHVSKIILTYSTSEGWNIDLYCHFLGFKFNYTKHGDMAFIQSISEEVQKFVEMVSETNKKLNIEDAIEHGYSFNLSYMSNKFLMEPTDLSDLGKLMQDMGIRKGQELVKFDS
jgi:hypothetical protein